MFPTQLTSTGKSESKRAVDKIRIDVLDRNPPLLFEPMVSGLRVAEEDGAWVLDCIAEPVGIAKADNAESGGGSCQLAETIAAGMASATNVGLGKVDGSGNTVTFLGRIIFGCAVYHCVNHWYMYADPSV